MTSDRLPAQSPTSVYRYAIYFAPRVDDPWWHAGSEWLGRDAFSGAMLQQPSLLGVPADEQRRLTAAPRRYGWHATLKAPFKLAEGVDTAQLRRSLRETCRALSPFSLPLLEVKLLDDFLALVPTEASLNLDRVARECVSQLHSFAAPLSAAELARRRAAELSAAQESMLVQWGYPYVMDQFQFHMSLTGALGETHDSTVNALRDAATEWFAPLPPCEFASVALFAEPTPGANFALLEHVALGE